jgi:hypothetical protein
MGIEAVYIFCFVVGAVYALVAGVAAGVFGGHTRHAELMSHDLGHDINHGADPTHPAAQGEVHLSPVSPVTITMFVTAFGGVGLIAIHALALPILLRLRGDAHDFQSKSVGQFGWRWWSENRAIWARVTRIVESSGSSLSWKKATLSVSTHGDGIPPSNSQRKNSL